MTGAAPSDEDDGGPVGCAPSRRRPDRAQPSLKARAIGYLSRREYSRSELARKLAPHAESAEQLDALLDALARDNWQSDARFAASVANRRSAFGARKILHELQHHQVAGDALAAVQAQLKQTERERAQAVWNKKFGALPDTPAERAKQLRFMLARGFDPALAARIVGGRDDA